MRWVVLVFLGACSYGVLSTIVKLSYDAGFTVQEVVGSQSLFGLLLIWPLTLLFPKKRLAWKQKFQLLAGGSTIGLTALLYYGSLQYIPASTAVVLLFQFTWIGVTIESLLTRTKPDKAKLVSLFFLLAGTVLAGGVLEEAPMQWSMIGILLGLLSAVSYSLFVIFSGRAARTVHPVQRSGIMAAGSLILVFLMLPPHFLWNGSLTHGLTSWALLLALFGIVIPTLFLTIGVPHTGASLASILGAVELPTAVFMSGTVLGEPVTALQWLGVLIILSGIALPELSRMRWERENNRKHDPHSDK